MNERNDTHITSVNRIVKKMSQGTWSEVEDKIVQEKAYTIYINSNELSTIVCSPWDLKNMAIGFLCSEGILKDKTKLNKLTIEEEKGLIYVEIEGYENDIAGKLFLKRFITPCCGRGRASFYYSSDAMLCKIINKQLQVSSKTVLKLANELEAKAEIFRETGGVHCAGLATQEEILLFSEDVGRHNTLDKIYGRCFLEDISTEDKLLVFSGRISSEILLKTVKMNIPILISRSAPTELALDLAEDLGVTVIGFARDSSFNVYTHADRII